MDSGSASNLSLRLRAMLDTGQHPVIVGLDGRSGVGKSTLSARIARELNPADRIAQVTVIEGDEFFAGGSVEAWNNRTIAENAERVIDWRRQRTVLEQLRRNDVAEWYPFDWDAEPWDVDDAPHKDMPVSARATALIVLEGVYSCRPELQDLLDLKILMVAPEETRVRQLIEREGDGDQNGWVARWSAAEDYYFSHIMPSAQFDFVIEHM